MSSTKSRKKKKKVITVDVDTESTSDEDSIVVFTDGSCVGNGTPRAVGGIGIFFPNKELPSVSKIFPLEMCTSQRTELYAILTALRYIKSNFKMSTYKICIRTDSEYSVNCMTRWVPGWIKRGWIKQDGKPVLNRELIETIYKYVAKYNIEFRHVKAHTNGKDKNSMNNAEADRLATTATESAIKKQKSRTKNNPEKKERAGGRSGSKTNAKNNTSSKPRNAINPRNNPKLSTLNSKSADKLIVELVK